MNKSNKTEKNQTVTPAPQTRRYDDAFKQQVVENWNKTGKPGTQIARELGISYPSLKEWKHHYHGDATPQRDDLAVENRALKTELARGPFWKTTSPAPAPPIQITDTVSSPSAHRFYRVRTL